MALRTVTREEIEAAMDRINRLGPDETRELMERMQSEQPYVQVYVAAICDRGDFESEDDEDAFVNLATIAWYAMCAMGAGEVRQVSGDDIDRSEEQVLGLYSYAEGEPEAGWAGMVQTWMEGCNQLPLLGFLVDALMSPNSPYTISEEGAGLIFTYIKTVIDCLDEAGASAV